MVITHYIFRVTLFFFLVLNRFQLPTYVFWNILVLPTCSLNINSIIFWAFDQLTLNKLVLWDSKWFYMVLKLSWYICSVGRMLQNFMFKSKIRHSDPVPRWSGSQLSAHPNTSTASSAGMQGSAWCALPTARDRTAWPLTCLCSHAPTDLTYRLCTYCSYFTIFVVPLIIEMLGICVI